MGMRYNCHLNCSSETKALILKNCIAEYKRVYPEMRGFHITQEHILRQIAEYYLFDSRGKP